MIYRLTWTSVWFYDISGIKREIKQLPLKKRSRFLELQELMLSIQQEYPEGVDFRVLYDRDRFFRDAVDESLKLFGLDPDWISAKMASSLLLSHEGDVGVLYRLEFPPKEGKGEPIPEGSDPEAWQIAALWSYMPSAPLETVLGVAELVPWNKLESIMEATNKMRSPSQQEDGSKELEFLQKVQAIGFENINWGDKMPSSTAPERIN